MLDKIIKLEEAKEKYIVSEDSPYYDYQIGQFMQYTIEAFKTLTDEIMKLQAKVKKLEQSPTVKHRELLNNCVNNDEAILHKREIEEVKS